MFLIFIINVAPFAPAGAGLKGASRLDRKTFEKSFAKFAPNGRGVFRALP